MSGPGPAIHLAPMRQTIRKPVWIPLIPLTSKPGAPRQPYLARLTVSIANLGHDFSAWKRGGTGLRDRPGLRLDGMRGAKPLMAIVERPEQQLDWIERAMTAAQESADPKARGWLGSLYHNAGWTYHDFGRSEEALATFQQGLEWQRQAGKDREARIAAWTGSLRWDVY